MKIKLEYDDHDIQPITKAGEPVKAWLGSIYEALRPLTTLTRFTTEGEVVKAVVVEVRTRRGAMIMDNRPYDFEACDTDDEYYTQDDTRPGWWVCGIDVTNEEDDRHEPVDFFTFDATDFMDGGAKAKEKFNDLLRALRRLIGYPPFDARRIARALKVFDIPPSKPSTDPPLTYSGPRRARAPFPCH